MFLVYVDADIGQVTFDANASVLQNKSFLFSIVDNEVALELDKFSILGIRDPIEVGIAEPSQISITVSDDDSKNVIYGKPKLVVCLLM